MNCQVNWLFLVVTTVIVYWLPPMNVVNPPTVEGVQAGLQPPAMEITVACTAFGCMLRAVPPAEFQGPELDWVYCAPVEFLT